MIEDEVPEALQTSGSGTSHPADGRRDSGRTAAAVGAEWEHGEHRWGGHYQDGSVVKIDAPHLLPQTLNGPLVMITNGPVDQRI
jgi:hypothetical protein